jgi:hypothetical protein
MNYDKNANDVYLVTYRYLTDEQQDELCEVLSVVLSDPLAYHKVKPKWMKDWRPDECDYVMSN